MNPRFSPRCFAYGIARLLLFTLCTIPLFAAHSHAQGAWNRRVEAIAVSPSDTGSRTLPPHSHGSHGTHDATDATGSRMPDSFFDITVVWTAHLGDVQSVPLDLSTDVDLMINGVIVASAVHTLAADPGAGFCTDGGGACGGGCGNGTVDGLSVNLLCLEDGPCTGACDCHCSFPMITTPFEPQPMTPGDEIMVLLRPAPGAAPEPDPSDDLQMLPFDGNPVFWDPQITSVDLQESPLGPGLYDVNAEGVVQYAGLFRYADAAGEVHLGLEADLRLNGVLVSSGSIPFDPIPLANVCGCGNVCGTYSGHAHTCVPGLGGCRCEWPWLFSFPSVPVTPGDVIEVILRPVPGALPELPGFEEDDDFVLTCCGPTDAPALTEASDALRLQQNQPNPFRGNTRIAFQVKQGAPAKLAVFDVQGRRIRTLLDEARATAGGSRTVEWDGRNAVGDPVPSGVYFYRLTMDGTSETRKMTLTK